MAPLQRYALVLIAVLAVLGFGRPSLAQPPGTVRLELTDPPGGLRIINDGAGAVTIQMAIAVQKQEASGWVPIVTEFNAIARCDPPGPGTTVAIAPATALAVQGWRGFSCSGQCNFTCRANIYYGPGTFRFVVTVLPASDRIASAAFVLPAEPLR